MFTLRPYQQEDADSAMDKLSEHSSTLGIAATGLGKAVVIAELCRRYVEKGKRCLVLADMGILVEQLAETIEKHTGIKPGIEKANQSSNEGAYGVGDPIVVGTVQTQFAERPDGSMRCHKWASGTFDLVVGDEAEAFLAPRYMDVLHHHLSGGGHLFGCTATPLRSDGRGMGQVFASVAFQRDIRWGIQEGYLVPARQGFVNVRLDFGKLKPQGSDYSDAAVQRLFSDMDERDGADFGTAIALLSQKDQGIVVAPHVASAKVICDYINAAQPGMAQVLHGELDDKEKHDVLDGFKLGHFQVLCSVNMLTKGFDHPGVANVFMCRPTRSKRLYTQVLGRGTRLIDPDIGALAGRADRVAAIAASSKPRMTMYNLVGINASVRDLKLGDILGGKMTEAQRQAVNNYCQDNESEPDLEEIEEIKADVAESEERARSEARQRLKLKAEVDVEFADALEAVSSPSFRRRPNVPESEVRPSVLRTLKRFRIPPWMYSKLNDIEAGKLAQECLRRHHAGLCSVMQAYYLKRHGIEPGRMTKSEAKQRLDQVFQKA